MNESEFKFLGYRISEIKCNIDDSYDVRNREFSQSINVEKLFSNENDKLVNITLDILIKSEDETFNFFVSIKGNFLANENVPQDLFDRLASNNAPAILYPFARAIVATCTAQANIPAVILPAINFFKSPKEPTGETNNADSKRPGNKSDEQIDNTPATL